MFMKKSRISKKLENLLHLQIKKEGNASFLYLDMATWCYSNCFKGSSHFLYKHMEEEKEHMMRLIRYMLDMNLRPTTPNIAIHQQDYNSLRVLFNVFFEKEREMTESIYRLVEEAEINKEYITLDFLQWFVQEQKEEELIGKRVLEIFHVMGDDPMQLYWIDKELGKLNHKT